MSPRIDVVPAARWGDVVGGRLARRLAERPGQRLCLPTGNTPVPAYAAFATAGGRLESTDVFLLDEFVLPAGHPARCDEMLRRDLLDRLPGMPRQLHTLDVEAEQLEDECRRYEASVADGGLDLTLLGIGANGHLGLNEPGSRRDSPARVVELHRNTIESAKDYGDGVIPRQGVTLGMAAIMASREIWLLVTGEHKAPILQRALTGPIGPEVPASFLQEHPATVVLADDAAAADLARDGAF